MFLYRILYASHPINDTLECLLQHHEPQVLFLLCIHNFQEISQAIYLESSLLWNSSLFMNTFLIGTIIIGFSHFLQNLNLIVINQERPHIEEY